MDTRSCLAAIVAVLAGCQSSGSGSGIRHNGVETPVTVEWVSEAANRGSLHIGLEDGRAYAGGYFQITAESRIEHLQPLWIGWHPAWRGWPHWHADLGPGFVRHYSGRVVANLAAADGERLRCRIRLMHPSAGLRGGGEGDCQLADGSAIALHFPPP